MAKHIFLDIETLPRLWTAEEKALAVAIQQGMGLDAKKVKKEYDATADATGKAHAALCDAEEHVDAIESALSDEASRFCGDSEAPQPTDAERPARVAQLEAELADAKKSLQQKSAEHDAALAVFNEAADAEGMAKATYEAAQRLKAGARVDARLKDPEKIMDAFRVKVDKSAVDKNALQICAIGWAIDDEPAQAIVMPEGNEAELVRAFEAALPPVKELGPATWVGHNLAAFDLPALWRRAIKYNCPLLREWVPHRKFDNSVEDLMTIWGGTDYRDMTGLKTIAAFLGIERGAEINGGDVKQLWANGEYDLVRDYCADDVELTRNVWKEITNR